MTDCSWFDGEYLYCGCTLEDKDMEQIPVEADSKMNLSVEVGDSFIDGNLMRVEIKEEHIEKNKLKVVSNELEYWITRSFIQYWLASGVWVRIVKRTDQ